MVEILNTLIFDTLQKVANYLPVFFSGLIVILIGVIIAGLLKKIIFTFFKFIRIDVFFQKTNLMEKKEVMLWLEVLTEVLRWSIVVLFMIPTFEIWGLSKASDILNRFLLYLPNVLVGIVIAFIGLITSNIGAKFILSGAKNLGEKTAVTFSLVAKWIILFFTILIILNQLGVAQDLIKIFFTGIVAMIALAGGLAFGLGGQDAARDILEGLRKKIK